MCVTPTNSSALPRGIRNNNPGDLRPGLPWQGIAGIDTALPDPPYLRFVDPEHGIRALVRTLISYRDHHGIDTLAGVFARWAPAADGNDPDAYAASVASALDHPVGTSIDLHDPAILAALAAAITCQENGHASAQAAGPAWYRQEAYRRGVALALGDGPAPASTNDRKGVTS
jgi:hypothetical protein